MPVLRPTPLECEGVIPKRPFVSELTLEREFEEFDRLKPRLREVWDSFTMRDEEPHTSIVVPSLTLDQEELLKLEGSPYFESSSPERMAVDFIAGMTDDYFIGQFKEEFLPQSFGSSITNNSMRQAAKRKKTR